MLLCCAAFVRNLEEGAGTFWEWSKTGLGRRTGTSTSLSAWGAEGVVLATAHRLLLAQSLTTVLHRSAHCHYCCRRYCWFIIAMNDGRRRELEAQKCVLSLSVVLWAFRLGWTTTSLKISLYDWLINGLFDLLGTNYGHMFGPKRGVGRSTNSIHIYVPHALPQAMF